MSDDPHTLFLIAHKVRGEPAFDVATLMPIDDEDAWIIPTSGHRAYPITWWQLDELHLEIKSNALTLAVLQTPDCLKLDPGWSDLRDHYTTSSASPRPSPTAGRDILSTLGLIKPAEPINRRI